MSAHNARRPGTQRIQLYCVERSDTAAGDDGTRGDCGVPPRDRAGARGRGEKKALARAAGAFRGGDDSDDQAEFVFLGVPSEAAVRAISLEMDGYRRGAVYVFFSSRDDAPASAVDLVRAGACRGLLDCDVARQKNVVGLR